MIINKSLYITHYAPIMANSPILYPLKTPENLCFSGVFRVYKMETLIRNGLIQPDTVNDQYSRFYLSALPANIYLFKVTNKNTRKKCEICSKQ